MVCGQPVPVQADAIRDLLARGEAARALAVSSQLLEEAPDDGEVLRLRAECLEAAGAWTRAVLAYRDLTAKHPQDDTLSLGLARALVGAGDAAAALAELDGEGCEAASLRARALTQLGRFGDAVAARRRCAGASPGATAELARALARAGAHDDADAVLTGVGPEHADLAWRELAAWRGGPDGVATWWASGAPIPSDLIAPVLQERLVAGDPRGALERFARLPEPPGYASIVSLVSEAILALSLDTVGRAAVRIVLADCPLPATLWSRIVDALIRLGGFDAARTVVSALPADPQSTRLRERLQPIVARLPADAAPELHVTQERRPGVITIRSPGTERVAIVLGALTSRLLHSSLASRGLDTVHIDDRSRMKCLAGVPDLADDWTGTVAALRRLARQEGPRRIYTVGLSGVGYTAIRLGIELGAEAVLALSPPTDLRDAARNPLARARLTADRVQGAAPEMMGDLRPLLLQARQPPRVHLWHGADMASDCRHADHLSGIPGMTIRAVPGVARHNILLDMVRLGLVDEALDELLADRPAA